jgi:hypothetical protein
LDVKFAQKHMARQIGFDFGPTELAYKIRDNGGENELTVDYAAFPLNRRRVFDRNTWLRNAGILWCVLGIVIAGIDAAGQSLTIMSGFWLYIGAGCLIFYKTTQAAYTVFDTQGGSIWVLEDKQFGTIIETIRQRRKDRLLGVYGAIDLENDPEN